MKRVMLLLAALLLLLVGGVAYASIPASDGTINGCYRTSNPAVGALIVIDSEDTCPSGTAPLDWNQTGPRGPSGFAEPQVVIQETTAPTGGTVLPLAECPAGTRIISGGFDVSHLAQVKVNASFPGLAPPYGNYTTDRWTGSFTNQGAASTTVRVHALCAAVEE